jgi:hypothetical protein
VVAGGSVKLAIFLLLSSVTVPVGFTHGAVQVTVMLAPTAIGAIASLKAAEMTVISMGTPMALLIGTTAVTVGATGETGMGATGETGTGATAAMAPTPRIGSFPPLHPAAKMQSGNAANHLGHLGRLLK